MSGTKDTAIEADSQNSDDSGNVYDFKDSKTSGVVVVTKIWEDSLPNDERSVPDISISTEKPSKNPLGYTITYHGNGLTFPDGTTENEIIVNASGKILSGQYKEISGSSGWYTDSDCTNKIEIDSNGLPAIGVTSDMELYTKAKTFVLKSGSDFNRLIPSTATSVVFTDETMPAYAELIDVDADGDGGVVAWMDGTVMKVSTQISEQKVVATEHCSSMFKGKSSLTSIEFSNLDSSNVTWMDSMFYHCSGLTSLNLVPLNTSNVRRMDNMFCGCSGLISLDLTPLNTNNVTRMDYMFTDCSNLTNLDLTPLDTRNVTDMNFMFYLCNRLTEINLTNLNTNKVTSMENMFRDCSELRTLDLSSLDTSKVTNMRMMFCDCSGLISLDLSHLNTQKVTDMNFMFAGCSSLTTLNLSTLDTSNVTNMSGMFNVCSALTSLNLSSFDTSNVTNMSYMFSGCSGLINLNLFSFDTNKVSNMKKMFYDCTVLTDLSLGNKFSFIGSDCNLPSGTWYASDGTAYTSDGTTCTIPNNKADTYTRR